MISSCSTAPNGSPKLHRTFLGSRPPDSPVPLVSFHGNPPPALHRSGLISITLRKFLFFVYQEIGRIGNQDGAATYMWPSPHSAESSTDAQIWSSHLTNVKEVKLSFTFEANRAIANQYTIIDYVSN
jgi:hypothetical protein